MNSNTFFWLVDVDMKLIVSLDYVPVLGFFFSTLFKVMFHRFSEFL